MNRRDYLRMVTSAGMTCLAPDTFSATSGFPSTVTEAKRIGNFVGPVDKIVEIFAGGEASCSEQGFIAINTANGKKLLDLTFNTFGGMLRWVAVPGEEILLPVSIEPQGRMRVNVVGLSKTSEFGMESLIWQHGQTIAGLMPMKAASEGFSTMEGVMLDNGKSMVMCEMHKQAAGVHVVTTAKTTEWECEVCRITGRLMHATVESA